MSKPVFPKAALPISEKDFANKYVKKIRKGKTAKDKASGTWSNRFSNRAARVEWQHSPRATASTFPGQN